MHTTQDNNIHNQLIDVAITLCAKHGWRTLTFDRIATTANVSLVLLQENFHDKNAILNALFDRLDKSLIIADSMSEEGARDTLFAMMMEWLDLAAPYRPAFLRMLNEGVPRCVLHRSKQWLKHLLVKANTSKKWYVLHGLTLGVIWVTVLSTWFNDNSTDLSQTMATLDTQLGNAESLWQNITHYCV